MCYDPELDISLELFPDTAPYFQTVISVLIWMIEIERIDIINELSLFVALLKEGHLEAAAYVIAHI